MENMAIQLSTEANPNYPPWLASFIDIYAQLSTDNLHLLANIYHNDVEFQDPMHKLQGFAQLEHYFASLYTNLSSCNFCIDEVLFNHQQAALYWTMEYAHPKLNGGHTVRVEGHSFLKQADEKVIFHRDYVDVGAMLYEHIPMLGRVIKAVKQRASQ